MRGGRRVRRGREGSRSLFEWAGEGQGEARLEAAPPEGRKVKLGEVCEIAAGDSAPQDKRLFAGGKYPFVRTADVGALHFGILTDTRDKLNDEGVGGLRVFKAGSLLFPKSGASTFLNHRVLLGMDACVASHLAVITPDKGVLPKYLLYATTGIDARSLMQDCNYPALRASEIANIEIVLPPLDEQRAIVERVEKRLERVERMEEGFRKMGVWAERQGRAVLGKAFGKVGEGTKWVRLGEVCEVLRGGSPRPIKDFVTQQENGLNWIKIGDVSPDGKFITRTAEKIKQEGLSKTRWVDEGDFLLSNSMSFGRPYILKTCGCIHDGWIVLKKWQRHFDADFLYWLLRSPLAQRQFETVAHGSTVRNLNTDSVAGIEIPIPSLEDQRAIVERLEGELGRVERVKKLAKEGVEWCGKLRRGVLAEAFG